MGEEEVVGAVGSVNNLMWNTIHYLPAPYVFVCHLHTPSLLLSVELHLAGTHGRHLLNCQDVDAIRR